VSNSKLPKHCPACSDQMKVTGLKCKKCGTKIKGDFELDDLFKLTSGQLQFLKTFISSRGSIKEVEKELNMSYPTVRNKLDELIEALGFEESEVSLQEKKENEEQRKVVLDKLEKGKLNPEQAAAELENL